MSAEGDPARRCGVLGSPIAHSLSPVLHRAAYAALGLDWRYDASEVTEDRLAAYVVALDASWRGLSLTMPLKRVAIDICDQIEPLAARIGAVNTMVRESDGSWRGSNTDAPGFVRALNAADVRTVRSALLVGAGATTAAALVGLSQVGARDVTVLARSRTRAEPLVALAESLGVDITMREFVEGAGLPRLEPVEVVVSTIPATAQPPFAATLADAASTVFDVIYEPATTPLLAAAKELDKRCISGFELLLHQATLQVELMTGVEPAPIEAMRTAGLAALNNRGRATDGWS